MYSDSLETKWQHILFRLKTDFGRKPNLQSLLFMIGVQELGLMRTEFSKEEKQDLMHVAVCALLEPLGYFEFSHKDEQGWPHYKIGNIPQPENLEQQENLLKQQIVLYFEDIFEATT